VEFYGNTFFEGVVWANTITATGTVRWIVPGAGLSDVMVYMGLLPGKRCAVTIAPPTFPDPITGNVVAATAREVDNTDPIDNGCLAHSPLVISSVATSTQFTVTPRNASVSFTPRARWRMPPSIRWSSASLSRRAAPFTACGWWACWGW
jgi:hypothetical protein